MVTKVYVRGKKGDAMSTLWLQKGIKGFNDKGISEEFVGSIYMASAAILAVSMRKGGQPQRTKRPLQQKQPDLNTQSFGILSMSPDM